MRHLHPFGAFAVSMVLFAAGCSRGPSDSAIATQIEAKFFSDPLVKTQPVSVTVTRGEVTLSGTVAGAEVQVRAFELALDTNGVRKLNDRMSIARAVSPSEQHQQTVQQQPPHRERVPEVSEPPVEIVQAPPTLEQVQAVQEGGRPPAPPRTAVSAQAPPARLAVAPAPPESVPEASEVTALAVAPVVVTMAAPPAEPRRERPREAIQLLAAGPTGPSALWQKWSYGFRQADPHVRIAYRPLASVSSIGMVLQGSADLGAVDIPMTNEQLSRVPNREILHFPAVLSGVVPICNVGGSVQALRFSGEALAAIFLGRVTRWDHPALVILNPGRSLPSADIVAIHRSDDSGASFVFTDYLSAVSPEWKARIGTGASVNWAAGVEGQGNEGVASQVMRTANSIGYVDYSFAVQRGLNPSTVLNRAGQFVKASPESLTAAASSMANAIPADFRGSIVNAPGRDAYPIASFLWLISSNRFPDKNKRDATAYFLLWMLTQGQSDTGQLGYAPLPSALATRERDQIGKIN